MTCCLNTKSQTNEVLCWRFIRLMCSKSVVQQSLQTCSINNTSIRIKNEKNSVPVDVSPLFSLWPFSSPSLEYSIFCPASRPELIPTCLPNKLRCNCLSELSACLFFFSPRNAPDKKHIFTHKNEITGNLRARSFGGNACYRAVQVDELLSPLALYQLETKRRGKRKEGKRRYKRKKEKKCFGNCGSFMSLSLYYTSYNCCSFHNDLLFLVFKSLCHGSQYIQHVSISQQGRKSKALSVNVLQWHTLSDCIEAKWNEYIMTVWFYNYLL